MELRHLRYFVAMAEEGSLTHAAGRRASIGETDLKPWPGLEPSRPEGSGRVGIAISASKPEDGALVSPNAGNALQQPFYRHGSRLTAFDDRLNALRRKIGESQKPADMGVIELELPGDLCRISIFAAAKVLHP